MTESNRQEKLDSWTPWELAEVLAALPDDVRLDTGFDQAEFEAMIEDQRDNATTEDEPPPLPDDPETRPGDLITLGRHRLLCGDNRQPEMVKRMMNAWWIAVFGMIVVFGFALQYTIARTYTCTGTRTRRDARPETLTMANMNNDELSFEAMQAIVKSLVIDAQEAGLSPVEVQLSGSLCMTLKSFFQGQAVAPKRMSHLGGLPVRELPDDPQRVIICLVTTDPHADSQEKN